MTNSSTIQDVKLVPPAVLARVLGELDSNREFDMGGYSVPTDRAFATLGVADYSQN